MHPKVLHIIDSGGLYGAEVLLLNLMTEQVKMGLEPAIASIGEKNIEEKPIETEAIERGLNVKKFRMRSGPNYAGALKIIRFAQKEGFNIIHSHGYKGNILFGLLPKKIRKLPIVATLHGWTSSDSFTRMKMYEWLDAFSLKFIDAVVLVNKGMFSNPKLKSLNNIKFYIINNGIPIPDLQYNNSNDQPFNQSVTQQTQQTQRTQLTNSLDSSILDFCSKQYTIGSIGRLSEEKGYRYLIEAFNLLIQKGINSNLIIIGEGKERNFLERLIEKYRLTDRVLLPGYCFSARNYLTYLDIFVLPSLTEGLPITLLEAMQAKVPIVATRVGGIPDVLKNNIDALLVEPRDQENLAKSINLVFDNSKLGDRLVSRSYNKVMSEYTVEKMAMKYLEVYSLL